MATMTKKEEQREEETWPCKRCEGVCVVTYYITQRDDWVPIRIIGEVTSDFITLYIYDVRLVCQSCGTIYPGDSALEYLQ